MHTLGTEADEVLQKGILGSTEEAPGHGGKGNVVDISESFT